MTAHNAGAVGDAKRTAERRDDPAVEALADLLARSKHLGAAMAFGVPQEAWESCRQGIAEHLVEHGVTLTAYREPDGLRAAVEALAEEWEHNYASMLVGGFSGCSIGADTAAKRLRALLAEEAGK